jgi:hypothetical protein
LSPRYNIATKGRQLRKIAAQPALKLFGGEAVLPGEAVRERGPA